MNLPICEPTDATSSNILTTILLSSLPSSTRAPSIPHLTYPLCSITHLDPLNYPLIPILQSFLPITTTTAMTDAQNLPRFIISESYVSHINLVIIGSVVVFVGLD
jgi:hypothetical protein